MNSWMKKIRTAILYHGLDVDRSPMFLPNEDSPPKILPR
jgi:hypothetical protein